MRIKMAASAAMVAAIAATGIAPASAGSDIPNREKWADRYLSAVCPANAAADKRADAWEQAFDGRNRVKFGTPMPRYLRKAFHRESVAYARAGMKFARWDWPTELQRPAARMARGFYKSSTVAQHRAEKTRVSRGWGRPVKFGASARTMRIALELPLPGAKRDGC